MSACHKIPFEPETSRLWSLLEIMLKKAALEFGRALADLGMLEATCESIRRSQPQVVASETLQPLAADILGNLKRVCILSDLDEPLAEIERFWTSLKPQANIEEVRSSAKHLRARLCDELEKEYYFQVDRSDVQLYGNKFLFGQVVHLKFPDAGDDIQNAGKCLALGQPTAAVFHLMRAMEVVVRKLSRRVKVTITPQTTWRQMTNLMDDKIKKMPDKTESQKRKKNDWEAARANLHHVGSVWRNNTMHPASTYTRSQAHDVLNTMRVFMSGLCAL